MQGLYKTTAMNSSLPERLKIATREPHAEAERAPLMATLLRGELALPSYFELLTNLEAIYLALEAELERHRALPAIDLIWFEGLARAPSLKRDISALAVELPMTRARLAASTLAYVERIHAISREEPHLLVAHAYVRYLGDLSGGQILRRIVGEKLHAPTAFYEFGSPDAALRLKTEFRAGLDRMSFSEDEVEAVVKEAVDSFRRHLAMFEEMAEGTGPTGA